MPRQCYSVEPTHSGVSEHHAPFNLFQAPGIQRSFSLPCWRHASPHSLYLSKITLPNIIHGNLKLFTGCFMNKAPWEKTPYWLYMFKYIQSRRTGTHCGTVLLDMWTQCSSLQGRSAAQVFHEKYTHSFIPLWCAVYESQCVCTVSNSILWDHDLTNERIWVLLSYRIPFLFVLSFSVYSCLPKSVVPTTFCTFLLKRKRQEKPWSDCVLY